MRGDPSGVYVLVYDAVPRPPEPREASDVAELAESGRGLAMIVPEFSAESGWYPTGDGKVTWALIGNPVTVYPGLPRKPLPKGCVMKGFVMEGCAMTNVRCSCGFRESGDERLIDHLLEVFVPLHSIGTDGLVHDEIAGELACSCGFRPDSPDKLDQHFLAVFTPPHSLDQDGKKHEPAARPHRR